MRRNQHYKSVECNLINYFRCETLYWRIRHQRKMSLPIIRIVDFIDALWPNADSFMIFWCRNSGGFEKTAHLRSQISCSFWWNLGENCPSDPVADLRGPNSLNFMQFLGKCGKIVCWRPAGELAPPPRGNLGSATVTAVTFGTHPPLEKWKEWIRILHPYSIHWARHSCGGLTYLFIHDKILTSAR